MSATERWKSGQFERTIKELSKFDNKNPEELESELTILVRIIRIHAASPLKGRNIVDLAFVYKQLLDRHKGCKTTLSLTQYQEND